MAVLTKFESTGQLSVDDYVALAAKTRAELDGDGRTCEVADVCRRARGLTRPCGFVNVGTVYGCPKRRRFSGPEPHKSTPAAAIEETSHTEKQG